MNIEELKIFVRNYVKTNYNEEITGAILQNVLIETINSLVASNNNYEELLNKPLINGVPLVGNKSAYELGLATAAALSQFYTKSEINEFLNQREATENKKQILSNSTVFYPSVKAVKDVTDDLNERIDNISTVGKFLSTWDCTTGLADTNPKTSPYTYNSGDYFIVSQVGTVNYIPDGTQYIINVPSTTVAVEPNIPKPNDIYKFDGIIWTLLKVESKETIWGNISGDIENQTDLNNVLVGLGNDIDELDAGKMNKIVNPSEGKFPVINADGTVSNSNYDSNSFASAAVIDGINAKLGNSTATNPAADKDFVNSSISTNTAFFKGTSDFTDEGWAKIIHKGLIDYDHSVVGANFGIGAIIWENVPSEEGKGKKVTVMSEDGQTTLLEKVFEYDNIKSEYVPFTYEYDEQTIEAQLYFYDDDVDEVYYELSINGQDARVWLNSYAWDLSDAINFPALGITPATNNDYQFFMLNNERGELVYERWKFNGSNWLYEYQLNVSGFTAAQLAALNSNITASKVSDYDTHIANTAIHVSASDKESWNSKYALPQSGIPESDLSSDIEKRLIKVAVYNSTTFETLTEWYNAGYVVVLERNGSFYRLNALNGGTLFYFTSISGVYCYQITVTLNGTATKWSITSFIFERTSRKVTSISSSSTDDQYPSAKCVYDRLGGQAISVVSELPANPDANTLYFIPE